MFQSSNFFAALDDSGDEAPVASKKDVVAAPKKSNATAKKVVVEPSKVDEKYVGLFEVGSALRVPRRVRTRRGPECLPAMSHRTSFSHTHIYPSLTCSLQTQAQQQRPQHQVWTGRTCASPGRQAGLRSSVGDRPGQGDQKGGRGCPQLGQQPAGSPPGRGNPGRGDCRGDTQRGRCGGTAGTAGGRGTASQHFDL